MRKKLIAVALSISIALGGINSTTTYADSKLTKVNILQKNGDSYTLENYVSSPEEAQKLQEYYFLNNISGPYKITIDAKYYENWLEYDAYHESIDFFANNAFRDKIDNGIGFYCNTSGGGVRNNSSENELIIDGNGKKYIVLNLENYKVDKFITYFTEMQEVKKKFLATVPNLDEMSEYEKVLKILEFMHYIKYGKDENGRTINDAYTALVKGKATCTGFAEAFNFLASCINMESVEIGNPGVHSWNGVKVCGNWFEVEPQSKNNSSVNDATRNINMTKVLRGSEYMSNIDRAHQEGDKRDILPVSKIDYMDYKGHTFTSHVIKWNGDKATFYRTCSECGEYENDGFVMTSSKPYFYHLVDREYIGTDCDVTKVSEKKCGDATVTKYEATVTVDGKTYTSEHTEIDGECNHVVRDSDIKTVKKATCSEEGVIEKTCEICGYTWTESTPKTGHSYITVKTTSDTCEDKSVYKVHKCSECGEVIGTSKKMYYSAHDYEFTSHSKVATCTEKGEDLYTCTICGKTETREVPMVAHETELRNYKAATCTEDGYTGDETCINCGKVISKGKKTYATGHSYVDTLETVYETDMSMGLTYKYAYVIDRVTCKKCDFEMIDGQTESKLVCWILADGTEVSKEDGYEYEYVTDKNGNLVPKKIDHSVTQPTSRPSISPTIYETGDYTDVEDTTKSVSKVPAKVKVSSAKNLKGKKIAIKWKKVKKATKYQVKAVLGSKAITKTTTKTSYTIKKLKRKKTYKIYVRAYNKSGYGKWSNAKKVKVNK
ncbi:transglutaminase-like domain-containing protein [Eubacterium ventriosum]|uniref:Fibronectin type III domain protein n=1 Tax=Eubacterium ventriosum ATCC 27560 TaxID=411463 RepID=A5Z3B9_9FIRM|nr:transglutaminase-like domain-containing protein [Eubacterium ventriosum]EDM52514.1 fibronectin type III domain protein [Eubacterium ventriosum ATCC 27560]UWP35368.1 transglutaminase-like domain-containing protein [Eubacterium ventriosum]